jgi:cytoskeletal protein RodZ
MKKEANMPRDLVRTGSLVLALLGATALSAGNAVAQQQQPPAAEPQQQQQQEKAQETPSGKMGKEEPSSHAPSAKPADNSVFVNGALAVPGAPENTDTVPAKFSEQNAADDKLSIAAYTFKLLTEEQRRAIYTALKGQPAGPAFNADIGAELPSSVELRPMPDDVVARVQQTKDYRYAVADNRVLLVSPVTRYVVGIFVDDVQAPKAGEGRRTP